MFRPHTLYIRIRIVRKVFEPAFAMKDQDVSDVVRTKKRTAMRYIGIDVSKATFGVAYSSELQCLAAVYAQCRRNYCQHGESAEGKELRQSHALYDQDR